MEGLLIGSYPLDSDDVTMLRWAGVERILNMVEDEEYRPGEREAVERALAQLGIEEHRLPLPDFGGLAPELIDQAVAMVSGWLAEGRRVYLHCRAGWQRSPAIAAALLALRNGSDIDEALEAVRSRKPTADPLPHQQDDLRRWWRARLSEQPAAGAP